MQERRVRQFHAGDFIFIDGNWFGILSVNFAWGSMTHVELILDTRWGSTLTLHAPATMLYWWRRPMTSQALIPYDAA